MATPSSHSAFKREYTWGEARPVEYSSQPPVEPERIALPSIRQVLESAGVTFQQQSLNSAPQPLPELRIPVIRQDQTKSSTTSSTVGAGTITPPEYVHSPANKRRRLSVDNEKEEERAYQIPRLYNSPPASLHSIQQQPYQASSSGPSPISPPRNDRQWPMRTSPPMAKSSLPAIRSSVSLEVEPRVVPPEPRPTLPSLPFLHLGKGGTSLPSSGTNAPPQPYHSQPSEEYCTEPPRAPQVIEPPQARQFAPTFHRPNRIQSLSMGSISSYDRTPFSPSVSYPPNTPHHYPEYLRMGDMGIGLGYGAPAIGLGMPADCTKQRKRRGNLPKETTDKLRSWFMAHLHHPYPTEDEKQELMRQTGLQMNQISNWFINARRRALPQMLNDQRMAEAKAAAQGIIPSTERPEFEDCSKRDSVPLSEGETTYEDHLNHRRASLKRGSV